MAGEIVGQRPATRHTSTRFTALRTSRTLSDDRGWTTTAGRQRAILIGTCHSWVTYRQLRHVRRTSSAEHIGFGGKNGTAVDSRARLQRRAVRVWIERASQSSPRRVKSSRIALGGVAGGAAAVRLRRDG